MLVAMTICQLSSSWKKIIIIVRWLSIWYEWKSIWNFVWECLLAKITEREKCSHCNGNEKNITLSSLERFSQWIWKENDMIKFMVKHSIVMFNLVPAKPVLLEKIRDRNIPKQYVTNSVAKKVGYDVLWLHPNTT